MSFAKWKKSSKKYNDGPAFREKSELCEAAYKAGKRAGKNSVPAVFTNESAAECCNQIATRRRAYASHVEHKADEYRAEGAEECRDALTQA